MTRQTAIYLRGPGRVEVDGDPVALRSKRIVALLTYLVAANRPVSRTELSELLWPDRDEKTARTNLRWALSRLRAILPAEALETTRRSAAFNLVPGVWTDVLALEGALRDDDDAALETALLASPGPLLDGFFFDESPEFETWLLGERARRRGEWRSGAGRVIPQAVARGHFDVAHTLTRLLIDDDPLDEAAHRLLLDLLARRGDDAGALAHFEQLTQLLDEELGIEPAPDTRALAERIRRRAHAPRHNLPQAPGPLVGRQEELQRLGELLRDPDVRLVSLVGLGGMGKTRLAVAAGRALLPHFLDGVAFISLVAVDGSSRLARVLLDSLSDAGFIPPAAGRTPPLEHLQTQLRERSLLLILDNFEQLVEGAPLLEQLLRSTPGVTMLVTTRQPLQLRREHHFGLAGLPGGDVVNGPATQLFVQAARRARPELTISGADHPALERIIRVTQGLPLALELAAQWVRLYDLPTIADRLEETLDYLVAGRADVSPRQRSIRAVFDYAWQLLDEGGRQALASLAILRTPFSAAAAEAVTGQPAPVLLKLVEERLVEEAGTGRFRLHQLLRRYATDRLADPDAAARRHARHFLTRLARWEEGLVRGEPATIAGAAACWDDVRAAWRRATESGDLELLEMGLGGYVALCAARNWSGEALADLTATAEALEARGGGDPLFLGRLLTHAARMARSAGDQAQARTLAERSLALLPPERPSAARADGLLVLAEIEIDANALAVAEELLQESGALYRRAGMLRGSARVSIERARLSTIRGRRAETRAHLLEALASFETVEDRRGEARCYYGVANLHIGAGEYEEAYDNLDRAAALYRELGDERGSANCDVNRGLVALHLGRISAAEKSTRRALAAFQERGDAFGLTSVLTNLGRIATRRGDYMAARVHFIRARQMAERVGEQGRLYLIRYFEAEVSRSAGALSEAAVGFAALLREVHERGMSGYVLFFLPGVGRWLAASGAGAEARRVLAFVAGHEGADYYARWQATQALAGLPKGEADRPVAGVDEAVAVALTVLETG